MGIPKMLNRGCFECTSAPPFLFRPGRAAAALLTGVLCLLTAGCSGDRSFDYPIQPVDFTQVRVHDSFWTPRLETNRSVTIPYAFDQCEMTHRIDNFAVAGGLIKGRHQGYRFNDSDVYKVIEGAAYALHLHPDPVLESYVDAVIAKIAAAQEEDGYLFTAKTAFDPDHPSVRVPDRWDNIRDDHELYCAGHLYEAAVAYCKATGKRALLDVALKNADLIGRVFGEEGLKYPPGHQEIEIGLAKLFRLTGERRYLDLARFFLDQRGDSTGHELYGEYAQDHRPVVKQDKAVGHAVRAAYLYTGMADIAALTGDRSYIRAVRRIWEDVAGTKLYITGGIGASGGNEGFGGDYHLPNAGAYCETCASIASAMWNHRLFLMTGDARYMDIAERVIYNSFLSGISMGGDRFFYPNRLQSYTGTDRSPWFACACCPSNIVRFLPSLPGYIYGVRGNGIFVNLFIGGQAELTVMDQTVVLRQETRYPWGETVDLIIESAPRESMTLHIRIPGWARGKPVPGDLYRYDRPDPEPARLLINGESVPLRMKDGYAVLRRQWQSKDRITLSLPMTVRRVSADHRVTANRGKVAVERGPLVYCAEGIDQPDKQVRHLVLPDDPEFEVQSEPGLLGGVHTIRSPVRALHAVSNEGSIGVQSQTLTLIPYYAWAHRGRTEMSVWLAATQEAAMPLLPPSPAAGARVYASHGRGVEAVNDQIDPVSSNDHEIPRYHWWPRKGLVQHLEYHFHKPVVVSGTEVYWFDDTGTGECRVPQSWRLLYLSQNRWKPVVHDSEYTVQPDRFNRVPFRPVRTRGLRMEIQSQEGWAGGILEWRIQ